MRARLLLPLLILALAWGGRRPTVRCGAVEPADGAGSAVVGCADSPIQPCGAAICSPTPGVSAPDWLVLSRGMRDYLSVWLSVLLINIPVALFWPARSHGLSGVVYGLLGYLLLIGWLERRILSIVLGLVAFWLYGSALIALIPGISPAGVSWIGHSAGFIGGLVAALAVYREPSAGGGHP